MKIIKNLILLFVLFSLIFSPIAYAGGEGLGFNVNSDNSAITNLEVSTPTFLQSIFSLFSITQFPSQSLNPGQQFNFIIREKLLLTCPGPTYLVFEVYNAPIGQQTSQTYTNNGQSVPVNINVGQWVTGTFTYTIPSNANTGTWSISGYIWCPSYPGNPNANVYSTVDEDNFQVTSGTTSCINGCSSGQSICMTILGNVNQYIGNCGNYDSDSCLEYPTSSSQMTNCGFVEGCLNGQCQTQPTCSNECSPSGSKQCSGNGYKTCDNYDSDSCLEWSSVTQCSSGQTCSNGNCVSGGGTIPNIQVISKSVQVVGNQVTGSIILKNTGSSMTENWIVEMQVVPHGTGLMSLINPPQSQTTCDELSPYNIHQSFKLNANQQTTITFVSPQTGTICAGTYDVLMVGRKDCWINNQCPETNPTCNLIPSNPLDFGNENGIIAGSNKNIAGNPSGCYEPGELIGCNNDNLCSSLESCETCNDCKTQANPGTDRCFPEEEERIDATQEGITLQKYASATSEQLEKSACSLDSECKKGICATKKYLEEALQTKTIGSWGVCTILSGKLCSFTQLISPLGNPAETVKVYEDVLTKTNKEGFCITNIEEIDSMINSLQNDEGIKGSINPLYYEDFFDDLTFPTDNEIKDAICTKTIQCEKVDGYRVTCVPEEKFEKEFGAELPRSKWQVAFDVVSVTGGCLGGGIVGATAGTVITPVIGTVIGTIGGCVTGAGISWLSQRAIKNIADLDNLGVCIAKELDKKECSDFIKSLDFGLSDDECTSGTYTIGLGIILLILLMVMFKGN